MADHEVAKACIGTHQQQVPRLSWRRRSLVGCSCSPWSACMSQIQINAALPPRPMFFQTRPTTALCVIKSAQEWRPQYRVHRSAGRGQRQVGSTKRTVVVLVAALCWCLAAALPGGCGVGAATEPRQLSGPLCAGLNYQGPPSAQSSNTVFLALRGTWAASGSYSYSRPAWGEGRGGGHKEPMRV